MTRETKIGLLVGLAFIIVIGILLSDHLTNSTDPTPAPLTVAGNSVRSAIATPGTQNSTLPAPTNVAGVQPNNPVPTHTELQPRPTPVKIVSIGSPRVDNNGAAPQSPVQVVKNDAPPANPQLVLNGAPIVPDNKIIPNNEAPINLTKLPENTNSGNAALDALAKANGVEIVALNGESKSGESKSGESNPNKQPGPPIKVVDGMQQYVVQPGDSLSKIAAKFYGTSTKAGKDAIINANASLKNDPNKVLVGRTYNIPVLDQLNTAETAKPNSATSTKSPESAAPVKLAAEIVYVVKEGDSLWKIAEREVGSRSATTVKQIKEMNQEALGGTETVKIGMKLKLPPKQTAVAAN